MRWVKDSEYSERCGRDSSRLDLVNKGILQFNRLQLSENMEAEADVEKPSEDHPMSHSLPGFGEFNHQAADSSCNKVGCAISDLNCLTDALKFSGGVEQIDPQGATKRRFLGRQFRVYYMNTQSGHASDSARAGGTFLECEAACHPYVSPPGPHYCTRTKRTVGKKRKRNSVFVHNLPVRSPP